jgi:DNA-binding Lrp family transcriptional regulator
MKLDRFDAKILDALQRDGRLSVVDLAELIGLSPTPCARRIKALESDGAIEGYAAILNPARVGLAVLAIVQVKLTEHTDETVARFEREIQLMDEVTKCLATCSRVWCSRRSSAPCEFRSRICKPSSVADEASERQLWCRGHVPRLRMISVAWRHRAAG